MINQDSIQELRLISLVCSNRQDTSGDYLKMIIEDAMCDALADDVDNAVVYIIKNHPHLIQYLKNTLEKHYPEQLTRIEKLLVLV